MPAIMHRAPRSPLFLSFPAYESDVSALFDFGGAHGFADRRRWRQIDAALQALHAAGRHAIRIIDAGCGSGTWLIRAVLRARNLDFVAIEARGFDIAPPPIAMARLAAAGIHDPRIGLSFEVADIADALAGEEDDGADLLLCRRGLLAHLPLARHALVEAEMARVAPIVLRAGASL